MSYLWDLHAGTPLLTFKGNKSERHGTAVVKGKLMVSSQTDRPGINVWVWQRVWRFPLSHKTEELALGLNFSFFFFFFFPFTPPGPALHEVCAAGEDAGAGDVS